LKGTEWHQKQHHGVAVEQRMRDDPDKCSNELGIPVVSESPHNEGSEHIDGSVGNRVEEQQTHPAPTFEIYEGLPDMRPFEDLGFNSLLIRAESLKMLINEVAKL